ncbi:unnamed protein product [Absidia cylindrospora]
MERLQLKAARLETLWSCLGTCVDPVSVGDKLKYVLLELDKVIEHEENGGNKCFQQISKISRQALNAGVKYLVYLWKVCSLQIWIKMKWLEIMTGNFLLPNV